MKNLSWTLLALFAIGRTDVHCRSIDASSTTTPSVEQKAVSEAVDTAAEILTVEAVGDAIDKALETEVQREATAREQAIAQLMKLAETEAIKKILIEASKPKPNLPIPTNLDTNLNIPVPNMLNFETGTGDNDNEISGTRDKRTVGQIGRMATCLFTILVNPNCFQEMRSSGGGSGGGGGLFAGLLGGGAGSGRSASSRSGSRQEAYNRQLRQWMEYQRRQIAKLNATEGGNYTTPFPILPPSPPPPEDDDTTTQRPGGFIGRVIQFKLNLIPNLFRTARSLFTSILPFIQNLGGGSGGGGGLSRLFAGLGGGGLGGGSSSSSFGSGSSGSSYRPSSSSSSLSSSSGSSASDSSSSGGAESSTYRISLG